MSVIYEVNVIEKGSDYKVMEIMNEELTNEGEEELKDKYAKKEGTSKELIYIRKL